MKKFLLAIVAVLMCSGLASAQQFSLVWNTAAPVKGVAEGNDLYLYFKYGMDGSAMNVPQTAWTVYPENCPLNGVVATAGSIVSYTYDGFTANAVKLTYPETLAAGSYDLSGFGNVLAYLTNQMPIYSGAAKVIDVVAVGGAAKVYTDFTLTPNEVTSSGATQMSINVVPANFDVVDNRAFTVLNPAGENMNLTGAMYGGNGQLFFTMPAGTYQEGYTFNLAEGALKDNESGDFNNAASVKFNFGFTPEYVDISFDAAFPWANDAGYEDYFRITESNYTRFSSINYSGWYIKDAAGTQYNAWKMAPVLNSNFPYYVDMKVPANLPINAEYTLVIPAGSITLADGNLNNALEVPFTYGTIGTPEPEGVTLGVWTSTRDGFTWNLYCEPKVEKPENGDYYPELDLVPVDDSLATVKVTPKYTDSNGRYTYFQIQLPEDLTTGSYNLQIPEKYFTIAESINYNLAATRSLVWENPNDPEPITIREDLQMAVTEIKCLNEAGQYEWTKGNTSTTKIEAIRLFLGAYMPANDDRVYDGVNKPVQITDADGHTRGAFGTFNQDANYDTVLDLEFYTEIETASDWTITVPAGAFTWVDWNDNKYTNAEVVINNAFQFLAPQEEEELPESEIEFDQDLGAVSVFNPTPNVELYIVYTIGNEEDTYAYSRSINYKGDEDGAYYEFFPEIMANVPNGAPMTVSAMAYAEGFKSSEVTETYTLVVKKTLVAPDFILDPEQTGANIKAGTVVTISNPNEGGVIKYYAGLSGSTGGLKTSTEKSVTVTVPESMGETFEIFALVAPAADEEETYNQSAPVEKTWTISGSVAVKAIEALGADARIFTLDGVEMKNENLSKGLYIIVRNGKAEKLNIR